MDLCIEVFNFCSRHVRHKKKSSLNILLFALNKTFPTERIVSGFLIYYRRPVLEIKSKNFLQP